MFLNQVKKIIAITTRVKTALIIAVAMMLSAAASCFGSGPEKLPNVVFIMADDLGYGDFSCYGATAFKTPAGRMLVVRYGPDNREKWECAVLWNKWRLVSGDRLYDVRSDPHQDKDVAAEHPDIVAAMHKDYEQWWAKTNPLFKQKRYIHLGSEKANPVMLYSSDWKGSYADNFKNLSEGNQIGYWDVLVERKGEYKITLSRWHPSTDNALDAPIQGPQGKGKAVPIAKARIKVGNVDISQPTVTGQKEVSFTLHLEAGKTQLSTWFYDKDGKELCSAYYTLLERK